MPSWRTEFNTLTGAEPDEAAPVAWSFLYFFCLLCGYYLLRPVRDEMAIEGGVQHLPWMMTATFLTLLLVAPLFGFLSARVPRDRLLFGLYTFFGAHLVAFYVLMAAKIAPEWVARVFFVWLSVFNLFVVSIFWSFMADLFSPEQGARLFGVIAAGGSTGAMVGPLLTTGLTYVTPIAVLMLVSAGFLAACGVCIARLDRWAKSRSEPKRRSSGDPLGGSMWGGLRAVAGSPYLLGICFYLFCLTTTATFIYLEQTKLVGELIVSPESRTRLFATIDFAVNVLAFFTQAFVTRHVIDRFGLAAALVSLPAVSVVGFGLLGTVPLLMTYILFTVLRRVGEYALAKPAREVLFTVVSREEKYKAKNVIDTAISRGGDAATGWVVSGIKALGVSSVQIAWVLVPIAGLWAWLGWFLAKEEERKRLQAVEPERG